MLTDAEIDRLTVAEFGPNADLAWHAGFARAVEREAYRRAAAECRAVAVDFRRTGNQCTDGRYDWKADSAEDCAVAVEALFWPDGEGK